MKKTSLIIFLFALLLASCHDTPKNATKVNQQPQIWPDYIGVTIPADIAPMNFNVVGGDFDELYVEVKGSKGGAMTASGDYADFDIDDWHALTEQNIGGTLSFTVYVKSDGQWRQYQDFSMPVSRYRLDDYGLTYRRIPPGYEVGGNIGIYQRDLHSFREDPILTETAVPGRCMNCHTPNRANPDCFTLQVRGEGGATIIQKNGHQEWWNTKTDSTKAAGGYASWHPDGRYVAYTTFSVHQSFFVGKDKPLEVYHRFSNIVVMDTQTGQLICDQRLMSPDWQEIFPAFSADGRTLYYSTSRQVDVPRDYLKVKCSLCAIPFDARTGRFGAKVDTLLNGERDDCTYLHAQPSFDGRWLMYTRAERSNFTIAQPSADLWLMDLRTRQTRRLDEVNSPVTESYHNWSTQSHWFVFSSKRGTEGTYTKLYLSCIDDQGRATKPFLLPQHNPWAYYHALYDAFNTPAFTARKVDFDIREAKRQVNSKERKQVTIRP